MKLYEVCRDRHRRQLRGIRSITGTRKRFPVEQAAAPLGELTGGSTIRLDSLALCQPHTLALAQILDRNKQRVVEPVNDTGFGRRHIGFDLLTDSESFRYPRKELP